jgi:DNA gyrase subunit B
MPELIERGHVYIGLPPLYKVKQGKNELYMKDDAALNAYLVNNAIEGAELRTGEGAPAMLGTVLEQLLLDVVSAMEVIDRHAYRIDRAVLEALLEARPVSPADLADPALLQDWVASLQAQLDGAGLGVARYQLRVQPGVEGQGGALVVEKRHHGLASVQTLALAQLLTGELRQLNEIAAQLHGLLQAGATVARGGKVQPVATFRQAQAWLMDEAKKGRTIQRFKGLGEMNPEQLWDTTVNPDTRRLLKVRIEDAVAADQIFSTLMGDVVEPRREFIEENALRVGNLDI